APRALRLRRRCTLGLRSVGMTRALMGALPALWANAAGGGPGGGGGAGLRLLSEVVMVQAALVSATAKRAKVRMGVLTEAGGVREDCTTPGGWPSPGRNGERPASGRASQG